MGKAIPAQHPAVVLRSHYKQLRALFAIAMIAVVGLTAAVVIVANDSDEVAGRPDSAPLPHQGRVAQPPSARYDGGPEEGTRGALSSGAASSAVPGTKDYSMNGATGDYTAPSEAKAGVRPDGGPEEGSRGPGH